MKRILCYGDSNTWGTDGDKGIRFDSNTRYTKVLEKLLGSDWEVVEEGMPGRTTVYDTDVDEYVNGRKYLYPCLESHAPLDVVTIMLGTNDLNNGVKANAFYAAAGVERLVRLVKHWSMDKGISCPQILIIAPPLYGDAEAVVLAEVIDYPRCKEESRKFRKFYQEVAEHNECVFLAAEDYTVTCKTDGCHITAESHIALAGAIHSKILSMNV